MHCCSDCIVINGCKWQRLYTQSFCKSASNKSMCLFINCTWTDKVSVTGIQFVPVSAKQIYFYCNAELMGVQMDVFSMCMHMNLPDPDSGTVLIMCLFNWAEKKTGRLWEFIRDLLLNHDYCPSLICWENYDEGMFRFVRSEKVAKLWGTLKDNPKMTYEKLSRAMR